MPVMIREGFGEIFSSSERPEWRDWLSDNFRTKTEVWFVFPTKASGEESISYNDAVEEALCFGWIDSVAKRLDDLHQLRRFTPRRKNSPYSRPNIERLIQMDGCGLIHPDIRPSVEVLITELYVFPEDIIEEIRKDGAAWENYERYPEPYRRIRIAYIDAARDRPDEYRKRLDNFISAAHDGRIIGGYGGVDKYYGSDRTKS